MALTIMMPTRNSFAHSLTEPSFQEHLWSPHCLWHHSRPNLEDHLFPQGHERFRRFQQDLRRVLW